MDSKLAAIIFIGIPGICYFAQAINYLISQNRVGMAVTFTAYVIANVGLLLDYFGI